MASHLFTPLKLSDLVLSNRIVVAPMCQYSSTDGDLNDWHLMHLGQYAVSGASLVFVEASAVEPVGRITPFCAGLYSESNEASMARVIDFFRSHGHARIGIQLAHAGRKASTKPPWADEKPIQPDEPGYWRANAPTAIPYAEGWQTPLSLDFEGMRRIRQAFADAAARAVRLGFDAIEIHSAHGYLLHEFLSPLSNARGDDFGGSLENRLRFPLSVFEAVRDVCPVGAPVGVRISATDWVEGGWDLADTVAYAEALQQRGCDFVDISSGGNSPDQRINIGPGYQVGFAAEVKARTGMTTIAVGHINNPKQAETIIASGQADLVALARGMLFNPRWPWLAAEDLRSEVAFPKQYEYAHPMFRRS